MRQHPAFIRIASLIIPLLMLVSAQAQSVTVSGTVTDQDEAPLVSATLVLMEASDSLLVSFATSEQDGGFEIRNVKPGSYLLQVSFLGFETQYLEVTPTGEERVLDMGAIEMQSSATTLDEVEVIGDYAPLSIRKDTIEYNADAFKPKTHERVEDLLKRLPGIEVETDGTVKAQGEEVRQVLVDGKEFFGKDPKVATKNLPADAVNKVQVFDKKSEMAEFSCIDDGNDEKAINLELKPDRRKGVFGDITAGYGTDDRFKSNVNVNKFSENEQLSLIGTLNNINQQGFSIGDYLNFSGGFGGRRFRGNGSVPINQGLSNGLVQSGALGLNYNVDFGEKAKLRASYFFNHLDQDIDSETETDYQLPQDPFLTDESASTNTLNNAHALNLIFSFDPDSTQNIKINSSFGLSNNDYVGNSLGESFSYDLDPLNTALTDNGSDADNKNADVELVYRKKLGKPGRVLTAGVEYEMNDRDQVYDLLSENTYFNSSGQPDSVLLLDQDQDLAQQDREYTLELTYTEPLAKGLYLEGSAERRNTRTELDKDVFDIENGNKIFNTDLSRSYLNTYTYDRGGIGLRWVKDKFNINAGLEIQGSTLDGKLYSAESDINKTYTNLLPDFRMVFYPKQATMLRLDYRTRVNEPSIDQLQPVVDNTDPLSIYIGNPDLDPAFSHSLSLRFHSFSQFTMISVFGSVSMTYTRDAITNATTVSPDFSQVTTPVNVDHTTTSRVFAGVGLPLKWIKSRISIHGNFSYTDGYTYVNAVEDNTDRINTSVQFRLNNQKREILEWGLGMRYSYNVTQYEDADYLNQDYFNQEYSADLRVNILKNWAIGGNLRYQVYQSSIDELNQDVPLLEAFVSRDLMEKRLRLEFGVFDALNKNLGIEQSSDRNYISESRIVSIARYFMFSAKYALNRFGGNSNSRVHMIRH